MWLPFRSSLFRHKLFSDSGFRHAGKSGGIVLLLLAGCSQIPDPDTPTADVLAKEVVDQKGALHREVWKTVYEYYYDSGFNGVDWVEAGRKTNELLDKAEDLESVYAVLKLMVGMLNDRHTYVLSPSEYAEQRESEFVGVGLTTSHHQTADDVTIVLRVASESPAERAGIEPGWLLLNGNEVLNRQMILGKSATYRFLDHNEQLHEIELSAVEIAKSSDDLEVRLLAENILYIRFDYFEKGLAEWFANTLAENASVNGLILDVRWNPGGLKTELDAMFEWLLPGGSDIGSMVTRKNNRMREFTPVQYDHGTFDGPLAVLVSPYSASCSEILASVIQYHYRGKIVGTGTTAGEVMFSPGWQLPAGGLLKIAARDYLSPSGKRLQGSGVTPDLLTDPRSFFEFRRGNDPTLEAALMSLEADCGRNTGLSGRVGCNTAFLKD